MKFKSVIGAFLFIFSACFLATIVFIQTEYFGKVVTRVVSDVSSKKYQTRISFRKFSLSIFPPGIELNQVQISKKWSEVQSLEGEFGTLGLYFGLVEFEEKKITLGELRVSDAIVIFKKPKSAEALKELDQRSIDNFFNFDQLTPFRIDKLTVENSKIIFNEDSFDAQKLKLFKSRKSIIARFQLTNLMLQSLKRESVDEIWGDAEIFKNQIKIYRLKIQHDVHTALVKGRIKNYNKLLKSDIELNGETQLYLKGIEQYLPNSFLKISEGIMRSQFNFASQSEKFSADAEILIQGIRSNFIYADEIRSGLRFEKKILSMSDFELTFGEQKISLENPAVIYDGDLNHFLTSPLKIKTEKLALSNILRKWSAQASTIEGSLTGNIFVQLSRSDYQVKLDDNFTVENFSLSSGTKAKPFQILRIKSAKLGQSDIRKNESGVKIKSFLTLPHSKIELEGSITPKKISFQAPPSKIDLSDFGNISQLGILGVGDLALKVKGAPGDIKIHLEGKTKGFTILGYNLDETEKDILIDLGASSVFINKMDSKIGKSTLTGTGSVNYKNADIALGITTNFANSHELREILAPILDKIKSIPDDLELKGKIDLDIFGKYKFPELKMRSRISFIDLVAFGESVNSGSFGLSLKNEILKFERIELNKGGGGLSGEIGLDLKEKSFSLKTDWENLELSSFEAPRRIGLNLMTAFSGKLEGGGRFSDYMLKLSNVFFNTKNSSHIFPDSRLSLIIGPKRISGDVNLLGDIFSSRFDFFRDSNSESKFKFQLKTDELKPILGILAGPHLELENISGRVNIVGDANFQEGLKNLDLTLALKNLSIVHEDFKINYISETPEFIVKDGRIDRWGLELNQPDLKLVTRGEGIFGKQVSILVETKANAKILEILSSRILSSEGHLENTLKLHGSGSELNYSVHSKTSDLDLSIENLPIQINNLKYSLSMTSNRLRIDQFVFAMENGSFNLKGDVFFDRDQPDVNLKFIFDKAEIPILGKSSLNISGEGIVLGNNYPYSVGGEVTVHKALIVNELNEFNTKSAGFSQVRYLPKTQESPLGKMFSLNLNIKAESPIRIMNSLMDVALFGEVRLLGSPGRLRGEGRLSSPLNSSRIFFKNNEYIIRSADINFNPQKQITNPDFDIQAMTIISSYKIYPKAYGDLERFNFDLTSEPALPRNSILSLIAFGYTDEIQSSLYAKDQQSLTQVGVGSFVFDRFKISDILNKQFGLQVNLGTVIEQSETDSLLSGRNQSVAGGPGGVLGRTRSATKIELKKRLDEALTLSVSSTMGGTIGQRQSMNLNYGVSKNIQLEGVYELRTNEEGQADIIYNSIGGDLKFRRTFK